MAVFSSLRRRRPSGDILLVAVVVAVLVVAAGLLHYVASLAGSINTNADQIAADASGIKEDTDTIQLLNRTNDLAGSILESAQPLEGQLSNTVDLANSINANAQSINQSAGSINESAGTINATAESIEGSANSILGTAGEINATAGQINATAGNINSLAAQILDVAKRINFDVKQINRNVNTTIQIARGIRADTRDLVAEARYAHKEAACIDKEINVILGSPYQGGEFCQAEASSRSERGNVEEASAQ